MKGLLQINEINLKFNLLEEAFNFLRMVGESHVEAVAMFAGCKNENSFNVKKLIIPSQTSYILENGLMYAVDNKELHSINVWLYENKMELIAQIHSHPQLAYHSAADDRYPIIDTVGGISIVVPYFGVCPVTLNSCAIYRLTDDAKWNLLNVKEVDKLFRIIS